VGYNRVFGYYIEVSKANLASVPENYIRKQTLVTASASSRPAQGDGIQILGAEEKCSALEYDLFVALRKSIAAQCAADPEGAAAVALLDAVCLALPRLRPNTGIAGPRSPRAPTFL